SKNRAARFYSEWGPGVRNTEWITWLYSKYTMYFEYSQRWIGGWCLELPPRVASTFNGAPYSRFTWSMVMPRLGMLYWCSCFTFTRRLSAWAVTGSSSGADASARVAAIKLVAMRFMALASPGRPVRRCAFVAKTA